MTPDTTGLRIAQFRMSALDRFHDVLVTLAARFFSHLAATLSDVNIVVKPTGSEVIRMPETVLRFGRVLGEETRRRVAVVADSDSAVA